MIWKAHSTHLSIPRLEELGLTLMRLEEKMEELKIIFGLETEDLNIELGPLGKNSLNQLIGERLCPSNTHHNHHRI
ncbi:gas vesicle protein GvpK [Neobacillus sp. B4I6]|jgi:hypothetical protein|uniref:gas vesicle protein GvpK n=1 Tax=Neobacillus sp. B4I6 TaxID=3373925 RepID=UPI003D1F6EE1